MKTYQDFIEETKDGTEKSISDFIDSAIKDHMSSALYINAKTGERYYKGDTDILDFQKTITDALGKTIPDIWSANHKISTEWHGYFVDQSVQYLLGNGVTFGDEATKKRLGKDFDQKIQEAAKKAQNQAVCFGFFNKDHIDVFGTTEFVPIFDEENGALMAGIRFWSIAPDKPQRATLYEIDGYTDFIKRKNKGFEPYSTDPRIRPKKRTYIEKITFSEIDGEQIFDGENYPTFPIVPLWNSGKTSELTKGRKGTIDSFDLMISGLVNDVDDNNLTYWLLKGYGGMTQRDALEFWYQIKTLRVASVGGDDATQAAEPHTIRAEYQANIEALNMLERQLYKDYHALRVEDISAGATNDQIQAMYEPINQKTDKFEYCVTEFITGILEVAGIEDEPSYTRSQLSNRVETAEIVLQSANYLSSEYIAEKLLTLLGDADRVLEVVEQKLAEELERTQEI